MSISAFRNSYLVDAVIVCICHVYPFFTCTKEVCCKASTVGCPLTGNKINSSQLKRTFIFVSASCTFTNLFIAGNHPQSTFVVVFCKVAVFFTADFAKSFFCTCCCSALVSFSYNSFRVCVSTITSECLNSVNCTCSLLSYCAIIVIVLCYATLTASIAVVICIVICIAVSSFVGLCATLAFAPVLFFAYRPFFAVVVRKNILFFICCIIAS